MRKMFFMLIMLISVVGVNAQTVQDLFNKNELNVTYLGIDFSHVKLIGNFSEFMHAGDKNVLQIRDNYFPRWNMVVVNEREKFDLSGMLRKTDIYYDIEMITALNAQTDLEEMESFNTVKFTDEQIDSMVNRYDLANKEGIGVVFIAECLNKSQELAGYHFVAFNMGTKEVLFHRRLSAQPYGYGLRNYWVNSLYKIVQDIKLFYFEEWRSTLKQPEDH
jgi:hypothetical protein